MPVELPALVKLADLTLLMTERRDLMGPIPRPWHASLEAIAPLPDVIKPMGAEHAAHVFLHTWRELARRVRYAGEG